MLDGGNPVFWVIVGLMVVGLMFAFALFAMMFRKVGPHEALVVYGFRGIRVVVGRGMVVLPMIETCRILSLEVMPVDIAPHRRLYTKKGVAASLEAVAQIKVKSDPESIVSSAERLLSKTPDERETPIKSVLQGHLSAIVSQVTADQIVKEPQAVADRIRSASASDFNKMGLEVISLNVQQQRDKSQAENLGGAVIKGDLAASG